MPPDGDAQQPSHHPGQYCIAMGNTFYGDADDDIYVVDYYFWNDASCDISLPYICQKAMDLHPWWYLMHM